MQIIALMKSTVSDTWASLENCTLKSKIFCSTCVFARDSISARDPADDGKLQYKHHIMMIMDITSQGHQRMNQGKIKSDSSLQTPIQPFSFLIPGGTFLTI